MVDRGWLQEIRSAIWSMHLVYNALTDGAPGAEMRPNLPTPAVSANVSDGRACLSRARRSRRIDS